MSTLRARTIRLAHANPDLRPVLLPLLARTAAVKLTPKDKAVIEAFRKKQKADGDNLSTDGVSLDGDWSDGEDVATWEGGEVTYPTTKHPDGLSVQKLLQSGKKASTPVPQPTLSNPRWTPAYKAMMKKLKE